MNSFVADGRERLERTAEYQRELRRQYIQQGKGNLTKLGIGRIWLWWKAQQQLGRKCW